MEGLYLIDLYYCQNKEISEYKDIFLETNIGILKVYCRGFSFVSIDEIKSINRLHQLDDFKTKYWKIYITEARDPYDCNLYLLISNKFILAIEYVLNTYSEHSIQEFRIIDKIDSYNSSEFDQFKELDIITIA